MLPKLPIGQQDFRGIREQGKLYVDKTEQIYRLIEGGNYFFLARPRRFGKSLTLSTIKELFQGSRELFRGRWIDDHWDWERQSPVVHIGFSSIGYGYVGLEKALVGELDAQAERFGIQLTGDGSGLRFRNLLRQLNDKLGQVVVLLDEYDKPLIDYLSKEDLPQAFANQKLLKQFYSILKDSDANLRFLLITGVSKFSKVGVFSDLNNLSDISLRREFNELVGITQQELETYFGAAIDAHESAHGKSNLRGELIKWYNGYSFYDGSVKVYNPWSLLNFFASWDIRNYWFSSGTPTFLVDLMRERFYYEFKRQRIHVSGFDSYQLDQLETTALLFQTGYLTIKDYDQNFQLYTLDYPNREVKDSMLSYLIGAFSHRPGYTTAPAVVQLYQSFEEDDLDAVVEMIDDLFQTIPHQLFINSKENLYHALIHLLFTYLGQYVSSEVSVLRGRVDAVVRTATHVYVLEFKLDGSAEEALAQIREKDYAAAHRASGGQVVAIGINFSSEEKRISEWLVEREG